MSVTHASVTDLQEEHRARRGILMGRGKHRRTPEAWKAMEHELEETQKLARELADDHTKGLQRETDLRQDNTSLRNQVRAMRRELAHLKALLGSDQDNPVNQTTHTVAMPERPRDEDDPAEISTHPIPVHELFPEAEEQPEPPRRVSEVKPVVRVYPFPDNAPPIPGHRPHTPPKFSRFHASHGLRAADAAGTPSERVSPDITVTQVLNLWDAPLDERRTA